MRWTDEHTLGVCCAAVGLVCALLVAKPDLRAVVAGPTPTTAFTLPATPAESGASATLPGEAAQAVSAPPEVTRPPFRTPLTLRPAAPTPQPPVAPHASSPPVSAAPERRPPAVAPNTPPAPTTEALSAPGPLARGRQLTSLLYSGQLRELWATFTPGARSEWGSLSAFTAYRAQGVRAYGAETGVKKEEVVRDGDVTYYTRTASFQRDREADWTVIFGLDPQGRVQEFGIVGAGVLPGDGTAPAR